MSKIITLFTVLLFFCGTLSVSADGFDIEGDIGLDLTVWDSDDDIIDAGFGGGGNSNYNNGVNEDLVANTTSGSEVTDMKNNPTGFHNIKSSLKTLRISKAGDHGYVLQCSESESLGLSYSIVSILGVNCVSNINLQGAYTNLETQGLPSGAYIVVVRNATQIQKVFKIIL